MTSMREKIARAIYETDDRVGAWAEWQDIADDDPTRLSSLQRADAVLDALMEPTEGMLDAGVSFALNVSISGEYNWSTYVRDKHRNMILAAKEGK